MGDELDLDLGDIPVPPEAVSSRKVSDAFDYPVAFSFAFCGVGQCGGRVAATFAQLGYGRVCAINTTIQDLTDLKLPADAKLDLGDSKGAGKDPAAAAAIVADKGEDIYDLYKQSWGDEVDYAFICLGAAGGTGAGAYLKAAEVARRYMAETKRPVKVGAIVALPKDAEGAGYARNAIHTMRTLVPLGLSPIIFLDNERIKMLYDPPSSQEHARANTSTAHLLHIFNRLAGSNAGHTQFDRADFAKLLDSGVIAFAAQNLTKWSEPSDISTAIRDQLRRNVLASVDLGQGTVAGLLYVLGGTAKDARTSVLDHGTTSLTHILRGGSTVFQGIYHSGTADVIKVMALIGGLGWPKERIIELAQVAGVGRDEIADVLGV